MTNPAVNSAAAYGVDGWAAAAVLLLPLLAALIGAALPARARQSQRWVAVGGAVAAMIAAVIELVAVSRWQAGHQADGLPTGGKVMAVLPPVPTGQGVVDLTIRADQLSAVIAVMVTIVAAAVQVYSVSYQARDVRYRPYAATVSLFTAAMLLVAHADNLLLLLIGWEVMGWCSYLLIGHDSQRSAARAAAVKAFLVTRVGDVGFVVAVVVLWVVAGTTSITELLRPDTIARIGAPTVTAAMVLVVLAVVGKSAQFPLHTWLPEAMEGPTPVSALIHAATMVAAGGVLLARLLPLLEAAPGARVMLAIITSVTMLGAALVAWVQTDLKRVLAWSTISQIGYLLAALAVTPAELAAAPALAHLLSHAGFKALLFLAAGGLAYQLGSTRLSDVAGAGRRAPLAAGALTLGLASLAGLPPLSGFWSKEAVLGAAEVTATAHGADGSGLQWAGWIVLGSALLTGVVTAGYAARTWWLVVPQRRPPVVTETPNGAAESVVAETANDAAPTRYAATDLPPQVKLPWTMGAPLIILMVPTVFGGLLLVTPLLPGDTRVTAVTAIVTAGLAGIAVAGTFAATRAARVRCADGDVAQLLPQWLRRVLLAEWGIDAGQRLLVVRPVRWLARLVTAGDHDVIDAYVRATAVLSQWTGRALRRTQTGLATGYLTWLLTGGVLAIIVGAQWR